MPEINWYPGHMAKSKRLLAEQMRFVDAVVELCDARAPRATRNPELANLCRGKARVLVLNKADLADERATQAWLAHYRAHGIDAIKFNANGGKVREIYECIERATRAAVERMARRGANKTIRLMVVGVPNVGKSTFINRLLGRTAVVAADRPGVTRANRWVKVTERLELLDTPGLLWPKLADQQDAKILSFLGSVRDEILDAEELAASLLRVLTDGAPEAVRDRFRLPEGARELTPEALLDGACLGRGWLLSGGRPDRARGAALVLDEFRAGRVGRISLQRPPAPAVPPAEGREP